MVLICGDCRDSHPLTMSKHKKKVFCKLPAKTLLANNVKVLYSSAVVQPWPLLTNHSSDSLQTPSSDPPLYHAEPTLVAMNINHLHIPRDCPPHENRYSTLQFDTDISYDLTVGQSHSAPSSQCDDGFLRGQHVCTQVQNIYNQLMVDLTASWILG